MHIIPNNFGATLRALRTEKQLTLDKLAEKTDLSISQLSALEKDKRDPSWESFTKICGAFDLPPELFHIIARSEGEKPFEERHLLREFKPLMEVINQWISKLRESDSGEDRQQDPVNNGGVVVEVISDNQESESDYPCIKILVNSDSLESVTGRERYLLQEFSPIMESIKNLISNLRNHENFNEESVEHSSPNTNQDRTYEGHENRQIVSRDACLID